MIEISIKEDIKKITAHLSRLQNVTIKKATVSALNKTATSVKSISVKTIAKETGIKAKKFKRSIVISKANRHNLSAAIIAKKQRAFNLIEFVSKAKTNTKAFKKKAGVTAKAWGKKKEYKGTFIGTGKSSGKFLVYARTTNKANPIKAIHGPHIPTAFAQKTITDTMKAKVKERFSIEMDRALIFYGKGEIR